LLFKLKTLLFDLFVGYTLRLLERSGIVHRTQHLVGDNGHSDDEHSYYYGIPLNYLCK